MYLSRIIPNLTSPAVLRDLADVHHLHRRVMRGFPDIEGPGRQRHGVLWRYDQHRGQPPFLLIQSTTAPDWQRLRSDLAEDPQVRDIGPVEQALRVGALFRFRLVANVTRRIMTKSNPDGTRNNGKRVPLRRDENRLGWLARKGRECGFVAHPDVVISPLPLQHGSREGTPITIEAVRFDGHLTVTDPALLWTSIRTGIGPAKSYGCGLISLARP